MRRATGRSADPWTSRHGGWAIATIVLLGACSPGSGTTVTPAAVTTATSTPEATATIAPADTADGAVDDTVDDSVDDTADQTTTTQPPPPEVPAGVQFGAPVDLPAGFSVGPGDFATNGIATVAVGAVTDRAAGTSVAAAVVSTDGVTWDLVRLDGTDAFTVPGYSALRFSAGDVAYGPGGFVATGSAAGVRDGGVYATGVDVLWHSPDGRAWRLIDVRPAVTGEDKSIELTDVEWLGDRYVAVGAVAALDLFAGSSRGLVLSSPDGVAWTETAQVPLTWSTQIVDVAQVGTATVFRGVEFACTADAGAFATFSPGGQLRLWSSVDRGGVLTPVPLPSDVGRPREPAPPDASTCPAGDDPNRLQATDERFGSQEAAVLMSPTHVVVVDGDRARTAISTDLTTWVTARLPGARPAGGGDLPATSRAAFTMSADDDDPVLITAGAPRNSRNEVTLSTGAVQTIAWRLDAYGSWTRLPAGRPQVVEGFPSLRTFDGFVMLLRGDSSTTGEPARLWRSVAGQLDPWGTCDLAPNASCAFADLTGVKAGGLDLQGIDLVGAGGRGADLTGARLVGGDLRLADLPEAGLRGADLTGADLRGAQLVDAELSFALFEGADLTGARVDGTFFLAQGGATATLTGAAILLAPDDTLVDGDFAGWDLTGVSITSSGATPVPATGANFTGADLTGARLAGMDLTGAIFDGAQLDSISFVDVVCPDGQPSAPDVFGPEACRL